MQSPKAAWLIPSKWEAPLPAGSSSIIYMASKGRGKARRKGKQKGPQGASLPNNLL